MRARALLFAATGQAFAEGKTTSEVILESAKTVAVSTLSAGIVPTVQQQYSALADFAAGKASIEDVEDRLANAAGGAILNAGLASYASAKLGYGWRGQPLSAEVAQLAQRGGSIVRGAKGLLEGGVERLHEAIGTNELTTLGRLEPRPLASPPANPTAYSVAFETQLKPTSYPRVSRGRHFQEANESLLSAMSTNRGFGGMMEGLGIKLERTPTGLALRKPPSGWVWHHAKDPGVMQLVPKPQHTIGSRWWGLLHVGGKGGYSLWGK